MDNSNHIREKNKRLAKNTLFMYIMTASTYILNLATIPYLTRILGPSVYGQIGLAIGYMTYIQVILDFGFILSATQKISQHREDKQYISEIIMSVSFIKMLLSIISMIVLFVFYKIGIIEQAVIKMLFVYMFAYIFSAMLPDYFYRGIENMKTISIRTVLIKFIFTVLVFVFVKDKEDVIFVPVSVLVGNFCALVFSIIDIRKNYGIRISKFVWSKIYSVFRESIPFFVSRFASTFYQALNVIILGRIYGSSALVGYYTSCDKIIALAKTGASPIADSLYPYMLENKNYRLIKKLLFVVMPIITIGVVLVGVFAEPICVILFGGEYRDAGAILRLMLPIAWVVLPTYIIAFPVMSPLGLVKYANISNVIGMFFQIFGLILLFLSKSINIYTICFLASLTELIVFIYRLIVILIFLKKKEKRLMSEMNILDFDYSNIDAYQGYIRDSDILKKSSSGGAARELMRTILNQKGVVFGAKYSPDYYSAEYCYIDDVSELDILVGSKYIYTNKNVKVAGKIMSISQAVAYFLKQSRKVLFIGLGCDVFAVKSFCEKKNISINELYLVDIICQGPTFPNVEEMYIKSLEKKYKSKAIDFSVRYKKYGWYPPYIRAVFDNGKEYYESFYGSDFGYAFNIYSKETCFKCPYKGINHVSDISLGDYWGINQQDEGYNKNGVSILLVHSRKGKVLLDSTDRNLFRVGKADVKNALINNPMYYRARKRSDKLDEFKELMDEYGLHKAVIKQVGFLKYYFIRGIRFVNRIRKKLIS